MSPRHTMMAQKQDMCTNMCKEAPSVAVHVSARHITLKEQPSKSGKWGDDVAKGASACSALGKGWNMLLYWERNGEDNEGASSSAHFCAP